MLLTDMCNQYKDMTSATFCTPNLILFSGIFNYIYIIAIFESNISEILIYL